MRRRSKLDTEIPEGLKAFDLRRWIQRAIDTGDNYLLPEKRALTVAELEQDQYVAQLLAPRHYLKALTDAIGEREAKYYAIVVLKIHGENLARMWVR